MRENFKILIISIHLLLISTAAENFHLKIPLGETASAEWEELAAHLVKLMSNNVDAEKQAALKVDVLQLTFSQHQRKFYGFYEALMKTNHRKMTFLSHAFPQTGRARQADYAIILMDSIYPSNAMNYLPPIYPNKNTKFFIIVNGTKDVRQLGVIWNKLLQMGYDNLYMIGHESGDFVVYNTLAISQQQFSIRKYEGQKYITVKETMEPTQAPPIRVIHHEIHKTPAEGKILGPDERMIDEFSKKMQIPYKISQFDTSKTEAYRIVSTMRRGADICLSTAIFLVHETLENVIVNEEDGICLLVPRNIPVSSFDLYSLPLDRTSMIMVLVSIISVVIFWKVISTLTNNRRSMQSILFAVYELTLNFGTSGLERLTSHENIMIYCYIFGTFILVSFYESIFLSLMLIEPAWRSAETIQELNSSDTKFNVYLDPYVTSRSNLPTIRPQLVQKYINVSSTFTFSTPEQPDPNLVYLVTCRYANTFVKSSKNFIGNRQLFDKMTLLQQVPFYTIRKGFSYAGEFMDMVRTITEAGIYSFWQKEKDEKLREGFNIARDIKVEDKRYIDLEGMYVPITILLFGCFVSLIVFVMEHAVYQWEQSKKTRMELMRNERAAGAAPRRKIKLDKWLRKYLYTKTLRLSKLRQSLGYPKKRKNEIIKARESKKGDYFKFKKFSRKTKKVQKPKSRFVQVRPCNEIQEIGLWNIPPN